MATCERCNTREATQRWEGLNGFISLCVDCRDAWLIEQTRHTIQLEPTAYEVERQKQRIQHLNDNYIEIEEHESDVWIVKDTRYDTSEPTFNTLEDAIRYGERQVGI